MKFELTKKQKKIHRSIHRAFSHIIISLPIVAAFVWANFFWEPNEGAPGSGEMFGVVTGLISLAFLFLFNFGVHHKFTDEDFRRRSEG